MKTDRDFINFNKFVQNECMPCVFTSSVCMYVAFYLDYYSITTVHSKLNLL